MKAERFVEALRRCGYDFFAGVPCSVLKRPIALLDADPSYVPAVREDAAVGMAAGAALGGRKPVVFMQNSGLGVCLNALASLSILYEIPALLVVSWRGHGRDAPEHELTGAITPALLRILGVPALILEEEAQLREADELSTSLRRPVALLVKEGALT